MKTTLLHIFLTLSPFFVSAQNVGINNPNPLFPLTFNSNLGDKICLWTDGTPTHYGFGIQSSLLQIFSKTDFDNIGFGYGSSISFNERVRIINKGDMGMTVNGRILLRNGTIPLNPDFGAGIWLNKTDNSGTLGFIGVQNNQNIGFYGGPLGWGLTYDAVNSRVGIGTSNPFARLHVQDNNVLFSSTGSFENPGPPPAQGAGKRMMWYGDKGAFRVGNVNGTHWDQDSIGIYSFASGQNCVASGVMSTALGQGTTARGGFSFAIGVFSIASGNSSTSIGQLTIASASNSTAFGYQTTASGEFSTSMGFQTIATGNSSMSIGVLTKAKAFGSLTIGVSNDDLDNPTTWIPDETDRLFQIGNGDGVASVRSNALTVLRNGNMGIGTTVPTVRLDVIGSIRCVSLTQTSDSRLKKGIVPLHNSLEKIIQLNGYDYYWKNENTDSSLQTGVLAQEVQNILPHLVKENKEGILSVNYSGLIPVLIESIKEQQTQIKDQQKQIDELKMLVENLLKHNQNPDKK